MYEGHEEFGGVRTRVVRSRGDAATPVLMLHGFADTARTWGRLQVRLAGHGYAGLAVDQPGHGEADRLTDDAPMIEQMVAFAKAAAESMPAPPVVIGNSLGGANALLLAARHPEVVRAVVAIAPAAIDHPRWMLRATAGSPEQRAQRMERMQRIRPMRAVPPVVAGAMVGMVAFGNPLRAPRAMRADWQQRLGDPAMRESLRRMAGELPKDYLMAPLPLADVTVPVLAVWGDRDRLTSISSRTTMERELKDLEFVTLRGIGHMPQVEAPGLTTKQVLRFLQRVAPEG